ncbi:MAG: hypothetical protein FJW68_09365 [Actinobacteria bacterium]|nr:hypothetical protein [Actinomycetota bacterium]
MVSLNARERLSGVFEGKEIDRIPTYDILHNTKLIEYLAGEKITPANAEDLLCRAANKSLDLIRHFAVPDYEGEKIVKEDDGFIYRYEWWTGHILEKPFYKKLEDVKRVIENDIEAMVKCTEEGKICKQANNHVNLFYEKFEYFEEVRNEYWRISEKLGSETVMLGPEMLMGVSVAIFRHGIDWWSYLVHDMPELVFQYLDAYYEYELAFVDSYLDLEIMPFVCSAGSTGMDDRLLFSPEVFSSMILKYEKKLFKKFKENGKKIIAFLDGYKAPIIKDFIDIGADAIDPFEPYCKMDVRQFRNDFPDTVACQPIDCTQLLPFGEEKDIVNAVIKAIEDSERKKILIGSTSEVHPNVNFKNAVAMYEAARSFKL